MYTLFIYLYINMCRCINIYIYTHISGRHFEPARVRPQSPGQRRGPPADGGDEGLEHQAQAAQARGQELREERPGASAAEHDGAPLPRRRLPLREDIYIYIYREREI